MFEYLLISYYVACDVIIVAIIFLSDFYLILKYRKIISGKIASMKSSPSSIEKINELNKKERNITKLVITNGFILLFLRIPEIFGAYFQITNHLETSLLSRFFDTGRINEFFDFLFTLHPTFQLILFYKFNINFRESFRKFFQLKIMYVTFRILNQLQRHKDTTFIHVQDLFVSDCFFFLFELS